MTTPALDMAVALLAQGQSVPAYLCEGWPADLADIARVRLGVGTVSGNGGEIKVEREGEAVCIAYDVKGQLVTSQTTAMPVLVRRGQRAKIGPIAFGKDGVPHDG